MATFRKIRLHMQSSGQFEPQLVNLDLISQINHCEGKENLPHPNCRTVLYWAATDTVSFSDYNLDDLFDVISHTPSIADGEVKH